MASRTEKSCASAGRFANHFVSVRCRSRSRPSARIPCWAALTRKLLAIVVLPTPPLWRAHQYQLRACRCLHSLSFAGFSRFQYVAHQTPLGEQRPTYQHGWQSKKRGVRLLNRFNVANVPQCCRKAHGSFRVPGCSETEERPTGLKGTPFKVLGQAHLSACDCMLERERDHLDLCSCAF